MTVILTDKQNKIAENWAQLGLVIGHLKKLHTTSMDEDFGISTDQTLNMIHRTEEIINFMGSVYDGKTGEG